MSDFADLRDLALKLSHELQSGNIAVGQLPSVQYQTAGLNPFLTEVDNQLVSLHKRHLTSQERDLLTYYFHRNTPVKDPNEVAERVAWIARGPNAFYWGPWMPYQDP
ncbi:MAG TPA: hypothetical protein PLX85_06450 [Dehalococcoidia bacterium]|nr:hypothetical protein [Dehalococcoidia bacterium]